ncbi:mechanosensitive ion channel [Virgibacillus sp. YIM 98842]|uniref:mechanosensitive ion channel n=1 Tax=Virgibacillus sp. YIM 98842 TaxID=2663533 RepID=UPI0013D9EE46|nr:mechanosensitive ion channel [Virgibacillus sp. YIM 98842]
MGNDLTNSFQGMLDTLISFIPNIIAALLLLLLAWIIALAVKNIFTKVLKKAGAEKGMVKSRLAVSEEDAGSKLDNIGKLLYFLVFILFLPPILTQLNMQPAADPISNMMGKMLNFIPNLLLAAIILVIGYFAAKIIKRLVYSLLHTLNIDGWFQKFSGSEQAEDLTKPITDEESTEYKTRSEQKAKEARNGDKAPLSNALANIVFVIVLIPILTVALETLNVSSITEPIISVLNITLSMIPNIFVAIILLLAGYYLAKFISDLLIKLLESTGINNMTKVLTVNQAEKVSRVNLSRIIGKTVQVIIIVFFAVEALNVLQLGVLNNIGAALIAYLPLVISALIILGLGFIGGNFLGNYIGKTSGNRFFGELIKYIIVVFAVFMTLDQLNFAASIVNLAFLFMIAGLSIAFAISFGVGGREFAKRQLEKFEIKMKKENSTNDKENNQSF